MHQYIVDAFTDTIFKGNPAAVCVLHSWLADDIMLAITRENNLSETAFVVKNGENWHLRWFTPGGEIDLCGHATLATAHVLLTILKIAESPIHFETLSGVLTVTKDDERYEMAFPAYELKEIMVTDQMAAALGVRPNAAYLGRDLVCVFEDASVIRGLTPNQDKLKELDGLLQHVTAFDGARTISRSFGPKLAVAEDPVCGSGHCHIAPYWMDRLGVEELEAYQASTRTGMLHCRREGNTIYLAGQAVLFATSRLQLGA